MLCRRSISPKNIGNILIACEVEICLTTILTKNGYGPSNVPHRRLNPILAVRDCLRYDRSFYRSWLKVDRTHLLF